MLTWNDPSGINIGTGVGSKVLIEVWRAVTVSVSEAIVPLRSKIVVAWLES